MAERLVIRRLGLGNHPWTVSCPRCPGWPNLRGPIGGAINSRIGWRTFERAVRFAETHIRNVHS